MNIYLIPYFHQPTLHLKNSLVQQSVKMAIFPAAQMFWKRNRTDLVKGKDSHRYLQVPSLARSPESQEVKGREKRRNAKAKMLDKQITSLYIRKEKMRIAPQVNINDKSLHKKGHVIPEENKQRRKKQELTCRRNFK